MLLNESPYGAGIIPMYCTIKRILRLSFRLIANVIPLPIILRRSFRFPNDRFGFIILQIHLSPDSLPLNFA